MDGLRESMQKQVSSAKRITVHPRFSGPLKCLFFFSIDSLVIHGVRRPQVDSQQWTKTSYGEHISLLVAQFYCKN